MSRRSACGLGLLHCSRPRALVKGGEWIKAAQINVWIKAAQSIYTVSPGVRGCAWVAAWLRGWLIVVEWVASRVHG